MNHTPGPWHLTETEPGIDADMDVFTVTPRYAGGRALVARVMDADDALVIAAAPDLLTIARALVDIAGPAHELDSGGYYDMAELVRMAHAAINRATKGQQ